MQGLKVKNIYRDEYLKYINNAYINIILSALSISGFDDK